MFTELKLITEAGCGLSSWEIAADGSKGVLASAKHEGSAVCVAVLLGLVGVETCANEDCFTAVQGGLTEPGVVVRLLLLACNRKLASSIVQTRPSNAQRFNDL